MSASDKTRIATGNPGPGQRARQVFLGIEARLAISFAAVAILAVTAMLVVRHGVTFIETTVYATRPAAAPPARIAAPVSAPVPAPVPQGPSLAMITEAAGFLPAFERAHHVLQARLEVGEAERRRELDLALRDLSKRAQAFPWAPGEDAEASRRKAISQVEAYVRQAGAAAKVADSRRALIEDYRQRLSSLEALLAEAIDKGWKVFGRLVARQSLITLSREMQAIENNAVALSAADYHDAAAIDALRVSEAAFAAELEKSRDGLRRTQGAPWEQQLSDDFNALVAVRVSALDADQKLRASYTQLNRDRGRIVTLVQASLQALTMADAAPLPAAAAPGAIAAPGPATDAASDTPAPATPESPRVERRVVSGVETPEVSSARKWVIWITVGVLLTLLAITISTITSVVRPVRRLINATKLLSEGGTVKVERGGIKELDQLAVAFNQMAGQLVVARATVAAHQETLENRVQERTRDLKHLSEHDALTQLPNRRLLLERMHTALQKAAVSGERVGLFFIDLDNFKNINDGMGHEFGDLVLLSVSQRLAETSASFGFAARLGGDEFTILYPRAADAAAIAAAGDLILQAFHRPLIVGDRELSISTSVGASIYPDHADQAETLLRAADAALFRAKALGRSQLHLFSPDLVEAALTKFSVEQGLRRALDQGEFQLVFQPEIDLASLEPTIVEALLRWRTPDGRLLTPDVFLAVAEESGLMTDVSDWVLRTAIATAASWHFGAWPGVRIAINVSPRQLFDARFVNRVEQLLQQHNLPPHCIEIELTENVLQTGVSTIEALRRLRDCGIPIALDDFGTGYSSFASLEVLPLTRVKLDRSLVAAIDSNPSSRAIAGSIISLCRNLGFEITAEGVERPEQLAILIELGATHIQGYLLSRPVSGDNLPAELAMLPGRVESLLLTMPVRDTQDGANPAVRRALRLESQSG